MQAGKLDRRVTLQRATKARDSHGEQIEAWQTYATVWANKRDVRARERIAADQITAEIDTAFQIRWREDVTAEHRLLYRNDVYDITGVAEIGRRDGLELVCTARRS